MPVRPDFTGIIEPENSDQLFVTGVGLDEALPAHDRSTLEPSLGRLLSQRVHNFMDGVERSVTPKELCWQGAGAPATDPPVSEHLDGNAKGLGDFTN